MFTNNVLYMQRLLLLIIGLSCSLLKNTYAYDTWGQRGDNYYVLNNNKHDTQLKYVIDTQLKYVIDELKKAEKVCKLTNQTNCSNQYLATLYAQLARIYQMDVNHPALKIIKNIIQDLRTSRLNSEDTKSFLINALTSHLSTNKQSDWFNTDLNSNSSPFEDSSISWSQEKNNQNTSDFSDQILEKMIIDARQIEQGCTLDTCADKYNVLIKNWEEKILNQNLSPVNKNNLMQLLSRIRNNIENNSQAQSQYHVASVLLNQLDAKTKSDFLQYQQGVDTKVIDKFLDQNKRLRESNIDKNAAQQYIYLMSQEDAILYVLQKMLFSNARGYCSTMAECAKADKRIINDFVSRLDMNDPIRTELTKILNDLDNANRNGISIIPIIAQEFSNLARKQSFNVQTIEKMSALQKSLNSIQNSNSLQLRAPKNTPREVKIKRDGNAEVSNDGQGLNKLLKNFVNQAANLAADSITK